MQAQRLALGRVARVVRVPHLWTRAWLGCRVGRNVAGGEARVPHLCKRSRLGCRVGNQMGLESAYAHHLCSFARLANLGGVAAGVCALPMTLFTH